MPFGRRGRCSLLRGEHPFIVVTGRPAGLIGGIFVLARWAPGRIRRV